MGARTCARARVPPGRGYPPRAYEIDIDLTFSSTTCAHAPRLRKEGVPPVPGDWELAARVPAFQFPWRRPYTTRLLPP